MSAPTLDLQWVDAPPPVTERREGLIPHVAIAAALRANTGVWAALHGYPYSLAETIRLGRAVAYRPAGDYDAVYRAGVVYAVHLGDGGPR